MSNFNFRRAILWLILGFVLLFTLRLGYGYWRWPDTTETIEDGQSQSQYNQSNESDFSAKRNYASTKYENKSSGSLPDTGGGGAYDQKYEKVGTITSRTKEFEKDVAKVKGIIKEQKGLIQYERQSGLEGSRYLHLAIGIPPESFDEAVDALKVIGKLTSIRIDKADKTNEFQKLKASRATLEAHLESLKSLKNQNGKIEELMNLEEKIESINSQLQSLGVSLGEFDSQNEFCTVKFTLTEIKVQVIHNTIHLFNRLFQAFMWTARFYGYLLLALLIGTGSAFAIFKIRNAIKGARYTGE